MEDRRCACSLRRLDRRLDSATRQSCSTANSAQKSPYLEETPCIIWTSDEVPSDFLSIGIIAPTADEERLVCNGYGTFKSLSLHPLAQWRWDNERDAVHADDAAKAKKDAEARFRCNSNVRISSVALR